VVLAPAAEIRHAAGMKIHIEGIEAS